MITDEQWERYKTKYDRLLWTIARKISGDEMTASVEDNHADLCVAALESINGYEAKTGKGFDEAFDEKLFDQYTKTVLWNRKAKKGIPLTKRMPFRNKHVSLSATSADRDTGFDVPDHSSALDLSSIDLIDMFHDSDDNVKKVVSAIVKDPSVVTTEGKLKYHSLVGPTGLSIHYIGKALGKIENTLNKEMSDEV